MSWNKKLCLCGVCVALCCVLPPAIHAAGLGKILSPLHLPVLLCGTLCGWGWGALCGLAGPILSCLISGMPGPDKLLSMVPELMTYGLVSGLLMGWVRTGKTVADLYLSLIPAMLLGRVAGGLAHGILYLWEAKGYTLAMWAASYFVGTAPAAVAQLVLIPAVYLALKRAGLVPERYPGEAK